MESATYRYELDVGMTCDGCSGAVTRILNKDPSKSTNITPVRDHLGPMRRGCLESIRGRC